MKKFINIACLLAILFFLGSYFKPGYVFNESVIAGGDTPSHYGLAHHFTENKKLFGWMPGNFAGFPTFQFYPPVSFWLIAFLDTLLPLPVAFNLIMVLGTFLLPLAVFYCLSRLGFPFPTPILGAILSLVFLFNEGNSMWGGNIPSTLAGEFSYSLGFALAVAFLSELFRTMTTGKGVKTVAVLVAVLGLTHGYPFVFFVLASTFFLIVQKTLKGPVFMFSKLYIIAFLLMGFWLIPALFLLPYTTPFNFVWRFESLAEFIPPLFLPLVAVIVITQVYLLATKRIDLRIIFLWYGVLMSLVSFLLGVRLGLVDIRFLPFAQILLVLLAAIGIGECLKEFKALFLVPVMMILLVFTGVTWKSKLIGHWISYNFSGFQEKALWKEFSAVNDYLKGGVSDPRAAYEHSAQHEGAGTVRAFELLPLFSGRSTLEGLYMQSSISSPFVFHIQSEISQQGSHPLMYYNYPRFDLDRGLRHLRLFNVNQFITITEATKNKAVKHPSYELEMEVFPYSIFRIRDSEDRYVVPMTYRPVCVETSGWKKDFFDWFRSSENQVFLLASREGKIPPGYRLQPFSSLDLTNLPTVPLSAEVTVRESVKNQEILIETDSPGHPLLVKISYHPNWHVEGADRIYLATPSFMAVFPEGRKVRLYFGPRFHNTIGWTASLVGIILLFVPLPFRWHRPEISLSIVWRWILFFGLILVMIVMGIHFHYDAHILYQKGLEHFRQEDYQKARAVFLKGIEEFPLSPAVDVTYLYYGLCYYKEAEWQKAIDIWEEFMAKVPEGRSIDEMLYHIGLCHRALGRECEAASIFEELVTRFPESRFSALVK